MKIATFCAGDFRDLLTYRDAAERAAQPEAVMRDVLNDDFIQDFLYRKLHFFSDRDEALTAPVVGLTGIDGLRLDFNFGLRLDVPEGNFRVKIGEVGGKTFLDEELSDVRLVSFEKIFIRWCVEVFSGGEKIFAHELDLEGKPVTIVVRLNALGDVISVLPAVAEFQRLHRCKLSILLPEYLREFAAHLYPELTFVDALTFDAYATYFPTMCIGESPGVPADIRNMPMELVACRILGLTSRAPKPTFTPTAEPVTSAPYVCIAVQASLNRKCWLWRNGWDIVVDYLLSLGYRVFCIDKNSSQTNDGMTIRKPDGAEDFTGDFSIMHRANMLHHAEFFIGLGSGLAWLADAVNCPVVMICGFSQDWFEFDTPWRVANRLVCNGCFNDVRVNFVEQCCPRHNGTPRELECQKKISPRRVLDAIERLIVERKLTPPVLKNLS